MKIIRKVLSRFETVRNLMAFMWENKMWWMLPLVAVIVLFSIFVIFTQISPLAPFIYVLF